MMVLLFLAISLILVLTTLATMRGEIVIAGFHRDGVRALDLAQAGIQEAARRLEAGRQLRVPVGAPDFKSSLNSSVSVTVSDPAAIGAGSAYREIQATATAGTATRRLSFLVLQQQLMFPPNSTIGDRVRQPGNPNRIKSGDVYSRSWIQYQSNPPDPGTLSYSAWRMSRCTDLNCSEDVQPPSQPFCYNHTDCTTAPNNEPKWYPGTRRSEYATSTLGTDIQAQTLKCPAGGGGSLPPDLVDPTVLRGDTNPNALPGAMPAYGFDRDTRDGVDRAVSAQLPCGLPYKWTSATFPQEDGTTVTRLVKTVVFEQWFKNYWIFNDPQMTFVKGSALTTYPDVGAVPPFPDGTMPPSDFYAQLTGGGTVTPPAGKDFGTASQTRTVYMDNSTWTINASSPSTGYGTMVIDGNLIVNITGGSNFTYGGTIIVKGTLTLTNGQLIVNGGLVARDTVILNGSAAVYGGVGVGSPPVGPSIVVGKGWWER